MKYRKRTEVFEVLQWNGENRKEMWEFITRRTEGYADFNKMPFWVDPQHLFVGEYVVKDVAGKSRVYSPGIFAMKFEAIPGAPAEGKIVRCREKPKMPEMPEIVEAIQFTSEADYDKLCAFVGRKLFKRYMPSPQSLIIPTPSREIDISLGAWLVKNEKGEINPYDAASFADLYEPEGNEAATKEELANRFTYHPPKDGQVEKFKLIRDKANELATLIADLVPDSREKDIALMKADEVVMWANAGIARRS